MAEVDNKLRFNNAIIAYAKGHYLRGRSVLDDMQKIALKTSFSPEWEDIIRQIAQIAMTIIRSSQVDQKIVALKPKKKDGDEAIAKINKSISPLTVYADQMMFYHNAIVSQIEELNIQEWDFEDVKKSKIKKIALISTVESMLSVITTWRMPEKLVIEKGIMELRSPNKKEEVPDAE